MEYETVVYIEKDDDGSLHWSRRKRREIKVQELLRRTPNSMDSFHSPLTMEVMRDPLLTGRRMSERK
jgi:hypothetical protein